MHAFDYLKASWCHIFHHTIFFCPRHEFSDPIYVESLSGSAQLNLKYIKWHTSRNLFYRTLYELHIKHQYCWILWWNILLSFNCVSHKISKHWEGKQKILRAATAIFRDKYLSMIGSPKQSCTALSLLHRLVHENAEEMQMYNFSNSSWK